jgi:CBS domain-containing protein
VVLDLDEITAGDRDILRDALRIVRQVREIIRVRFNLAGF